MKVLTYSMGYIGNVIEGSDITVYKDFSAKVDGKSYISTNVPIVIPDDVEIRSTYQGFDANEDYPDFIKVMDSQERLEYFREQDYKGIIIDELLPHNIVSQVQVDKINPDFDYEDLSKEELQQMVRNLQEDNNATMRALADLMDMVMGGY